MKKFITLIVTLVAIGGCLNASHLSGGDIVYRLVDSATGTYEIIVNMYRYCGGISMTAPDLWYLPPNGQNIRFAMTEKNRINLTTGLEIPNSSVQEVTPVCQVPLVPSPINTGCPNSKNNTYYGVMRHRYARIVTTGGGKFGWIFFGVGSGVNSPAGECCRPAEIDNINNPGGSSFWLQCGINTNYANSSPEWGADPVPYWCKGTRTCYVQGPVDLYDDARYGSPYVVLNGNIYTRDSFSYEQYAPWQNPNLANFPAMALGINPSVTYMPGYSKEQFMITQPGSGGVTLNKLTGEICATPHPTIDQDVVTGIMIWEYRATINSQGNYERVPVGYISRDIFFVIKGTCTRPTPTGLDPDAGLNVNIDPAKPFEVTICGEQRGRFEFKAVGLPNETIFLRQVTAQPANFINYNFTTSKVRGNNVDTITGIVTYDSTVGSNSVTIYYEVYYCNSLGVLLTQSIPILVRFVPDVYFKLPQVTYCVGQDPVRLQAYGAPAYRWSSASHIVKASSDSSWIDVAPPFSRTYITRGVFPGNIGAVCNQFASIDVLAINPFTYTKVKDTVVACLSDSVPIGVIPDASQAPYTYSWTGSQSSNLFNPTNFSRDNTIATPILYPSESGKLNVSISSSAGCVIRDSVIIDLKGVYPKVDAWTNKPFVCIGDTIDLSASITPMRSGPSIYRASNSALMHNLPDASPPRAFPSQSCSGVGCLPNIFGVSSASGSSSSRMLYLASELKAPGVNARAGIISELTLDITTLNIASFDGFEIRIGKTNANALTPTVRVPMFTVYARNAQNISTGINSFVFDNKFDWNGTDNLIIEFCVRRNVASSGINSYATFSSVPDPNRVGYKVSNTPGVLSCDLTTDYITPTGVNYYRPKIGLRISGVDSSDTKYTSQWTPAALIKSILPSPRAKALPTYTDSVFNVVYGSNICKGEDTVHSRVDKSFRVTATASRKVVCRSGSGPVAPITLTATVVSNGPVTTTWQSLDGDNSLSSTTGNVVTVSPSTNGVHRYVARISSPPCVSTDTVYITVNSNLVFSLSKVDPICNASNGKLKVNLPLGTTADLYDFTWSNAGSTTDSIVNLAAGSYTANLQLKADPTCNGSATAVLTPNVVTLSPQLQASKILCFGYNSDSITSNVSSILSPGPYSYTWNVPGEVQSKMFNKPSGSYTLTVTDQITQCTGTATINVTQPSAITASATIVPVNCFGENNGSIQVIPSGGTPSSSGFYQWSWTSANPQNDGILNNALGGTQINLYAGSVSYTITDINGCTFSDSRVITEPASELNLTPTVTNATVVNGTDGYVTTVTTGGTPPYTSSIHTTFANGSMNPNPFLSKTPLLPNDQYNGLSKNKYIIITTDSKGCTTRDTVSVRDIVCDIRAQITPVKVNCFGASTGSIIFSAVDSLNYSTTNLYTYTIRNQTLGGPFGNGSTHVPHWSVDTFVNLPASLYTIRVQTNKGCDTTFENISVEQNPDMQLAAINLADPSCRNYVDGKATISVVNAASSFGPFTYNFGSGFQTNNFVDTLSSGSKTTQVMNSLGCIKSVNYSLTNPVGINSVAESKIADIKCFGESTASVSLSPSPANLAPFSYRNKPGTNLDTTSNVYEGLNAGSRTVEIWYKTSSSATNMCRYNHTINITEPTQLVLSGSVTNITCFGQTDGQITLNSSNGNVLSGTAPHTYTITNTATGVAQTQSSNIFGSLAAGIYAVRVTDRNGCIATAPNLRVWQPAKFKGAIKLTAASCREVNNGRMEVVPSAFEGGTAGTYRYLTRLINDNGTEFFADNTSDVINNLIPTVRTGGQYQTTIYDGNGCPWDSIYRIDTAYKVKFTRGIDPKTEIDSARCFNYRDGQIRFNPLTIVPQYPAYTYRWEGANGESGTDPTFTGGVGEHWLTVRDINGCEGRINAAIHGPADLAIVGRTHDVTCYGGNDGAVKIEIKGGNPGYTVAWGNPIFEIGDTVSGLSAGLVTVFVSDRKGCRNSEKFLIKQPQEFKVIADYVKNITCYNANNGSIKLNIIGGNPSYTYNWSHNPTLNSPLATNLPPSTNYYVKVVDAKGCVASNKFEITEPSKLEIDKLTVLDMSCPKTNDGKIQIFSKGGTISEIEQYQYSIDGGRTFQYRNTFSGLSQNNYNVVTKDNNGCLASRLVTINEPEELFVKAIRLRTPDTLTMGESDEVSFNMSTRSGTIPEINKIEWTPSESVAFSGNQTTAVTPFVTTKYNVNVYYHNQCLAQSEINVPVFKPRDFFVPTAFSPGKQDGINDVLYLYGNGIKQVEFRIFNRWGEKVFETSEVGKGWDGYYKGEMVQPGVYSYSATVIYLDGSSNTKSGSITLIR